MHTKKTYDKLCEKGLSRERMRKLNRGFGRDIPGGQVEKFGSDNICDREPLEVLELGNNIRNCLRMINLPAVCKLIWKN